MEKEGGVDDTSSREIGRPSCAVRRHNGTVCGAGAGILVQTADKFTLTISGTSVVLDRPVPPHQLG